MLNILDTRIILDRIENPPPCIEFGEDSSEAAMECWQEDNQRREEHFERMLEAGDLEDSPERAIQLSLSLAASAVAKAEARRSKIIAVAVHVAHLPTRSVAEMVGLHPRTVEKRANDPDCLGAIIEFKERELEILRKQVQKDIDN